MPNQPKTPTRNVRIPDDTWRAAQAIAAAEGVVVSDVVRQALAEYVAVVPTDPRTFEPLPPARVYVRVKKVS